MVAVLNNSTDSGVHVGDVGTVVELLPLDGLEVEFLSRNGRTRHVGTLSTRDVLVLNRERTRVARAAEALPDRPGCGARRR